MKKIFFIISLLLSSITGMNAQVTDALKIKIARGSYSDETIIRFASDATYGFDSNYDAWKLFSYNAAVPNIFTKDDGLNELAINALPQFTTSTTTDVFAKIGTAGTYTISAEETGAFTSGVCIKLKDLVSGQVYEMRTTSTYTLSLPVIAQSASARFRVYFSYPSSFSYQSRATGNWSTASTWMVPECACATASSAPSSTSNIAINTGHTVTVDATASCADMTIVGTLTANADLNISGNWTNDGTFNAGTQKVTFNGSALQYLNGTATTSFNNFTIYNTTPGKALQLNVPASVNGTFGLKDGHVVTSSVNNLSLGANASVSLLCTPQDSSFVKGPMKYTVDVASGVTKVFPIGQDNSYRRIDLTVDQQTATSTTYSAEMISSSAEALGYAKPAEISNVSTVRYHTITQSPSADVDMAQARIYFSCAGTDDKVKSLVSTFVVKDDGAATWENLGETPWGFACSGSYWGNFLSGTFTSFAGTKFALANTGDPVLLGVTLGHFDAKVEGTKVKATWSTASESNSADFTLERSTDGKEFETVATIPAAGYSATTLHYSSIDHDPYNGHSFYRIKETDFNGSVTYSEMASVNTDSENAIHVYPNPASEYLNIDISASQGKEALIVIRDVMGKECYSRRIVPASDNETLNIDLKSTFSAGIYSVTALNGEKISEKMLIIK